MEAKRTVSINLYGQQLTVRTTESEESLQENVARIRNVLDDIQRHTGAVDTARLYALGLLHLGRELNMLETRYKDFCQQIETRLKNNKEHTA